MTLFAGVCSSLIQRLHVLSIWSKTFTKRCTIFTITWQNYFFLALIDWSRAFDFRISFGKTLIGFDFDEKLTQSIAQVTMWYHVSKDFLPLHFAVDQVLSVSGYDLENGRMPCKQKYCIKNMAVKIPNFILFHFCLLCWLNNNLFCVLFCCSCK